MEVASLRSSFANILGLSGHRPDLVLRFGRGPTLPRSLRRPVGFAIYYTVAGPVIPGEGLALLSSIDTNLDIFRRGSTEVTIKLAE